MLFYTYILNTTKYTSHKTNKISIFCFKNKNIPMTKIKKTYLNVKRVKL